VLHDPIWSSHPNAGNNAALDEYVRLGEMAFMDRKWEQFRQAVKADPADFLQRVWNRFLEATLVYVPFNTADESRRPDQIWYARLVYPLPFVCLVALLATAPWSPLSREQWIVIGVYFAYLGPYIVVSYYDRYKFPVLGLEVLAVVWGGRRFLSPGAAEPSPSPGTGRR
jgi:hypothetical protein